MNRFPLLVIGFAARSGSGKTTLLKQLIPELKARGLRIGVIKHTHHTFDIDSPGKDSYELRKAGAEQMLITSKERWALVGERLKREEPDLNTALAQLDSSRLDLVLVEGFKRERFSKIELHRKQINQPLLYPQDSNIIAVASDDNLPLPPHIARLPLNNPIFIADFICQQLAEINSPQ